MLNTEEVFRHLITLSQDRFSQGEYKDAYLLLVCALDYGHALKCPTWLAEVRRLAIQQLEAINRQAPTHPLASGTLTKWGGINLYGNLIRQAQYSVRFLEQQVHADNPLDKLKHID